METREKARHAKDFKSSDAIREALKKTLGFQLHEQEKICGASGRASQYKIGKQYPQTRADHSA
jgi:hypothetical protein